MTIGDQFPEDSQIAHSAELELVARRELALNAVDAIADVVGADLSVARLIELSSDKQVAHSTRLMAGRGLRFIAALGEQGSEL